MNQNQQVGLIIVLVPNMYLLVFKGVSSVSSRQSAPMMNEDSEGA
jgi:uncharacterized membrane protein (UPF0136 family)